MSEQSEANKKIVLELYERLFNQKDVSVIDQYIAEDYTQHNPNTSDGRAGILSSAQEIFKACPKLRVDVKRVLADGNLVAIHAHWRFKPEGLGLAIVDIVRVENGRLQEHWDVVQPVPDPAKSSNPHGMF